MIRKLAIAALIALQTEAVSISEVKQKLKNTIDLLNSKAWQTQMKAYTDR